MLCIHHAHIAHVSPILTSRTIQQAEELALHLEKTGFNAAAFHAGMEAKQKTHTQDRFMAGQIDIVSLVISGGWSTGLQTSEPAIV